MKERMDKFEKTLNKVVEENDSQVLMYKQQAQKFDHKIKDLKKQMNEKNMKITEL